MLKLHRKNLETNKTDVPEACQDRDRLLSERKSEFRFDFIILTEWEELVNNAAQFQPFPLWS